MVIHHESFESPKEKGIRRRHRKDGYELAVVLDRVLFSPRKCLDRDLDRTDLALLVLLLSSTSGLSSYFALWILQEKLVNNPARGPIG